MAALEKYELSSVELGVTTVFVASQIRFEGELVAGAAWEQSVAVSDRMECGTKRSVADFEITLHHEIASRVLRRYPHLFDGERWRETNPVGFEYRGSGIEAIRAGHASRIGTDELLANGFVSEYAQAAIEEDFSETSARMFHHGSLLSAFGKAYPKIERKFCSVASFWSAVSDQYSYDYFASLAPARGSEEEK